MVSGKLAYSPAEAFRVLGICRTSGYEEIRRGKIRTKKFGRRTLIPAEELQKWLASLPDSASSSEAR